MKKVAVIITVLSLLLGSIAGVSADSSLKDIEVTLSDTPAVVNLGETIELTATAEKHGSDYIDAWENADKAFTEPEPITDTYISKAVFKPQKPGVYVVSYVIKMTSGSSDTIFFKRVERTIEVIDHTVVGAAIKDLNISPIYDEAGNISLYRACGTVYTLWSNTTETPSDSVYFFFGPDETTKDIDVQFIIDGKQYYYTVTVNR